MYNSGIYQIRNIVNGHIYIGSSKNLVHRRDTHFSDLELGKHHSVYLQRAYNKYGKECLVFEVLLFCDNNMLLWFEQRVIDSLKPVYNICKIAGNRLGAKHSPTTLEKLRISHTGYIMPETQKSKIGRANRGHIVTEETRRKIGDNHRGKVVTKETKEKISLSGRGRAYTEERNKKIGDALRGRTRPKEIQDKIWANRRPLGKEYPGIVSPEGVIYEKIFNMSLFCREHSLCSSCVLRVLSGEHSQHKGWTKLEVMRN